KNDNTWLHETTSIGLSANGWDGPTRTLVAIFLDYQQRANYIFIVLSRFLGTERKAILKAQSIQTDVLRY
ncbi:MAG: hypothetical protein DRR08_11215, partial [Candidatus Parabeggiatoa sp. nov. 2]